MKSYLYELYLNSRKTLNLSYNGQNDNLPSDLFMVHNLTLISLIFNVMVLLIITPYKKIVHGYLLDSSYFVVAY